MTTFYILILILSIVTLIWLIFYIVTDFPLRQKESGYKYVYVQDDGNVRELYTDEIDYLQTNFHPGDGNRPYIKYKYSQRTPEGKISGYIKRRRVPKNMAIRQ